MAFNYSPKIVTDGLALYLDAANSKSYVSGSTSWNDISRTGVNGTLTNGPVFNSGSGGNITFDGNNDYIDLSSATSLWTSNFTINFYIKSNVLGNQFIFSNGSYGSAATNIWFDGGGLNNFAVHLRRTDGTGAIGYNFTLPTSYNALGYYSVVYNTGDNTLKLYQNSNLVENKSTSLVDPSWMPNGWRLGNSSGWSSVSGSIYNFSIYNRALTAQEVLQNYNATKTRFGLT
jgi:hypothetical protein